MDPVKRIATKLGKRLGVARKGVFPRRRQVKEEEEEEEEEEQQKKKKKKKKKRKKNRNKSRRVAGRPVSPKVAPDRNTFGASLFGFLPSLCTEFRCSDTCHRALPSFTEFFCFGLGQLSQVRVETALHVQASAFSWLVTRFSVGFYRRQPSHLDAYDAHRCGTSPNLT